MANRFSSVPGRRLTVLVALCLSCIPVQAQFPFFELQTHPDRPVALEKCSPTVFRSEGKRRLFVTLKNVSDRAAAALLFQQAVPGAPRDEVITLERVSVVFKPHETRRLSINVEDVWNRLQNAGSSGVTNRKPLLSIVAVEFIDGSLWSAPVERERESR